MRDAARLAALLLAGAAALMPATSTAATAKRETVGKLPNGTAIEAITLTGKDGVSARILNYGATLQSLRAPDRDGRIADVTLGNDDPADYVERPSFFGVTVGRYANRIAGGSFTLDGTTYQVALGGARHALHGGVQGFDKRAWRVLSVDSGASASVTLALTSADGDQGFPGTLQARVTYSLDDAGALTIRFEATSDKPTVINMTNHAVFNLGGEAAEEGVLSHRLTIPAASIVPVDKELIPTGALRPVEGTPFDFREAHAIGERIRTGRDPQIAVVRGYDHNFALDKGATATPQLAARLEDPASGRVLEVLSTEPGLQVYTANFLNGTSLGKGGRFYRMSDGIALEPQKFPDAPNRPDFVSPRLDPGRLYAHTMIYRMSVAPR